MRSVYNSEWDEELKEILKVYLCDELSIDLKKILKQYRLFLLEEK